MEATVGMHAAEALLTANLCSERRKLSIHKGKRLLQNAVCDGLRRRLQRRGHMKAFTRSRGTARAGTLLRLATNGIL